MKPRSDMAGGDGDSDGTHNKISGFVTLKTDGDYTTNNVDWILKESTSYFLHIYLNDGTGTTFTRSFTTASYPTSIPFSSVLI
jgi:hypothetical protein